MPQRTKARRRVLRRDLRCYPRRVPFGLQLWEILLVLMLALLIFGPKKLPEMGRSLGRGMREFKESISGKDSPEDVDDLPSAAELPPAPRERDPVS
jgi:sec-independent protein translocase protein TatA